LWSFLHHVRAEAVFFAERDRLFVGKRSCGRGEEDEGLIAKLSRGDSLVFGKRVLPRNDSNEWFREERLYLQTGCLTGIAQEGCIEFAFEKLLHNGGGERLVQLEVHLGIKPAIASQHRRQRSQHRGSNESYSQEAFLAATDAARLVHVLLHVAESSPCPVQENFAGAGKSYSARRPEEEWIAKDLFEFANLLREWRLSEMKAERCTPEVQLLCHGYEVSEMAKLDIAIHIQYILMRTNKILDVSAMERLDFSQR
jgi:hypothetical protein